MITMASKKDGLVRKRNQAKGNPMQEQNTTALEMIATLRLELQELYLKAKGQGNYHEPEDQKRVGEIGKEIHRLQGGQ